MSNIVRQWPTVVAPGPAALAAPSLEPDTDWLAELQRAAASISGCHARNAAVLADYAGLLESTRAELVEQRAKLLAEVDSFKRLAMREVEQEREHLATVWRDLTSTLEREKRAMQGIQKFASEKIRLDIGGTSFATSLSTLTAVPDSLLGSMFSGRFKLTMDQDGSYFIDRDGRYFHHVLNYLRDPPSFTPPADPNELTLLRAEAEYFQLHQLAQICADTYGSRPGPAAPSEIGLCEGELPLPVQLQPGLEMVLKLVVIGDSQVGKSWLVQEYSHPGTHTKASEYRPTMGVEFAAVETTIGSGRLIKAQLWDIPGQDKYRPRGNDGSQVYYRGAAGAVLVYSANNRQSFESVREKWLPELRAYGESNLSVMLVASNSDPSSEPEVNFSEGEQLAEKVGALFTQVSALSEGSVNLVFETLLEQIVKFQETQRR